MKDLQLLILFCYTIFFWKKICKAKIITIIDFIRELNIKNIAYMADSSFLMHKTYIDTLKLDQYYIKTYIIVISTFEIFLKLDC